MAQHPRQGHLRQKPSFLAPIAATLPYGMRVEGIEEKGDWRLVRAKPAGEGWIHASALTGKKIALKAGAEQRQLLERLTKKLDAQVVGVLDVSAMRERLNGMRRQFPHRQPAKLARPCVQPRAYYKARLDFVNHTRQHESRRAAVRGTSSCLHAVGTHQ